jgi:hypothetical protein
MIIHKKFIHDAISFMSFEALYNAKNFTSGFMRKRSLYNYKNFTDAHSLDDEPSDISEHGDFVWTVDPNNKPPS